MAKLMNIGFGNMVNTDKIVCIVSSDSAPAKRMVQKGKEQENLIDATQGRRTKSVIFTENNKIILSALQPETLAGRFNGNATEVYDDTKEQRNPYRGVRIFRLGKRNHHERINEKYADSYALSISATTRNPRPGETNGVEYFFRTKEQFEQMIKEDALIEYAQFVGNYYGTPKAYVEEQLEAGKMSSQRSRSREH